ncbi:YcxB family protein [Oryzibacter oryziterrae]|uniref:YcxB family protein n=1 Tax=Oryzibacter oryziterrae TaxID=2766474 RepID=UPI001F46A931|nr:YcxB family protein [Oryzibacter oryziterrae]
MSDRPAVTSSGLDGGEMTDFVDFTPTRKDVAALTAVMNPPRWGARHWGRYERLRLTLAGAVLMVLVFMAIKIYAQELTGQDLVGWIFLFPAMAAGALTGNFRGAIKARRPIAAALLTRRRVVLNEDDVAIYEDGGETRFDWLAVQSVERKGGFILFTTRAGVLHFVPERAFATTDDADAFFGQAAQTLKAVRQARYTAPNAPMRTAICSIGPDDWRAFFAVTGRRKQGWRGALPYGLGLLAVFLASTLLADQPDGPWWGGMAAALAAAYGLNRLILWADEQQAIARCPIGQAEVEFWDDHLSFRLAAFQLHVADEMIGAVHLTPTHVFVMTQPTEGAILPLALFEDRNAMVAYAAVLDDASRQSRS